MQHTTAIILEREQHGRWLSLTLGAAQLVHAQPGQFVALRCSTAASYDPLLRQPLFLATIDQQAGTCGVLVGDHDPAWAFLFAQPRGAALDLLGPLGHGWPMPSAARTLALLGIAEHAPVLFSLAHAAVARGISVSVTLGAATREVAPAPFLLPAAAEYHVAPSYAAAAAALAQLSDGVLRWADALVLALPFEFWSAVARRVQGARVIWNRGFAHMVIVPPLACAIGVCGVCGVETRHAPKLACVDGPLFDLHDLVRL